MSCARRGANVGSGVEYLGRFPQLPSKLRPEAAHIQIKVNSLSESLFFLLLSLQCTGSEASWRAFVIRENQIETGS